MPKILRLPELSAPGREAVLVEDDAGDFIPQADLLADLPRHAGATQLNVQVSPADRVEELAPHLARIARVGIVFPGPGEGRGYTFARLLRQRYGFAGEIRATGAGVKQDLLFFMVRCGFDAFDLVATENLTEARQALTRFTLAYQPALPRPDVREARFTAARG
jgi:uncharacterized protein (DUF934 family)